ncbi:MAG: hypothetical protein ACRD0U_07675, partial [Acidimicrobiales bacterium]
VTSPDFASLVDWVEGRLDADADARVAEAVAAGDERTTRTVEWLRGFLATTQSLPLHQPPAIVRQNLRRHFTRRSEARRTLVRPAHELTATLLFDSRKDLALAGVRAADDADDTLHLAFTTDRADVVLDVRRHGKDRVRIEGQVLLAESSPAPIFEATASGPGFAIRTVEGDELGRFCLLAVPGSATELRITNGDLLIVAALDLGDEERGS